MRILRAIVLVIGYLLLVIPTAHAVGISVSPPSLELSGATNKKITGTFAVTNPSRETVIYEITNDGLLPLAITPTTFLLEPGKVANVTVDYTPNNSELNDPTANNSVTSLSILGRPLTVNPTQAASGVKLPVAISTGKIAGASASRFDSLSIGLIAVNGALLLWLAYLVARRFAPVTRGRPEHNRELP